MSSSSINLTICREVLLLLLLLESCRPRNYYLTCPWPRVIHDVIRWEKSFLVHGHLTWKRSSTMRTGIAQNVEPFKLGQRNRVGSLLIRDGVGEFCGTGGWADSVRHWKARWKPILVMKNCYWFIFTWGVECKIETHSEPIEMWCLPGSVKSQPPREPHNKHLQSV